VWARSASIRVPTRCWRRGRVRGDRGGGHRGGVEVVSSRTVVGERCAWRQDEQPSWGQRARFIDGQAGPARPGTGPGKHGPSANGPAQAHGLIGPCLGSPRAWPLAQAWPSGPLFVPGQPARRAQKNGPCQHQPVRDSKQQKT
jgi:hypothetical protein